MNQTFKFTESILTLTILPVTSTASHLSHLGFHPHKERASRASRLRLVSERHRAKNGKQFAAT